MTFWPLTNNDFPTDQTSHQFHDLYTELDLHQIMSGFHGAFATGVASQQGTLTLPDTWFRPPFWDLLILQLLRPNSSNLPCLYSTFHLEYPLVLSRFCYMYPRGLTGLAVRQETHINYFMTYCIRGKFRTRFIFTLSPQTRGRIQSLAKWIFIKMIM